MYPNHLIGICVNWKTGQYKLRFGMTNKKKAGEQQAEFDFSQNVDTNEKKMESSIEEGVSAIEKPQNTIEFHSDKPEADDSDILIFDLETQFLADEVGGWGNKAAMKISVAVLYSTLEKRFYTYTEDQAGQMAERMSVADLVVGYNQIGFDYAVLQPYTFRDLKNLKSLDLLVEINKVLGHRLKLDQLAKATLQVGKSADGLQAVQWYREGRMDEIKKYCRMDVQVTRDLWKFGRKWGYLLYEDRDGRLMKVPATWKK